MAGGRVRDDDRGARDLAAAASLLVAEAARIVDILAEGSHQARVANRAADQVDAAAQELRALVEGEATQREAFLTATWALSAAAVALTQAREVAASSVLRA